MIACWQWVRACLLMALVVLATAPIDLSASQPDAGADLLMTADRCCASGVDAAHADRGRGGTGHGDHCLPVCGTGAQAILPAVIEVAPSPASNVRPGPDVSAYGRFAHLEPHPPRRLFATI